MREPNGMRELLGVMGMVFIFIVVIIYEYTLIYTYIKIYQFVNCKYVQITSQKRFFEYIKSVKCWCHHHKWRI